jgi:hypothetical protein
VSSKRCLSLCYIRRKPFTYLVWRLAPSPNESKRAFTCATSPRCTIGYVQNDFLSRWYVWRKPCTYLTPTLTLSPKRKKWNSKWPMSPRSSIRYVQNDLWAYGTFDANRTRILSQYTQYLQTNPNGFHFGLITEEYHRVHPKWFLSHWYIWDKLCTNLAPTLTLRCEPCTYLASRLALSPNGLSFHLSLIT